MLPPRLHRATQNVITEFSKAAWGLLVFLDFLRIFTQSSISPSQLKRQWKSRYVIHAGLQLIAKEFRYILTVRVTAAVYYSLLRKRGPSFFTN